MAAHVYDIDEVLEKGGGHGAGENEILKGEQQNKRRAFEEKRFGLQGCASLRDLNTKTSHRLH